MQSVQILIRLPALPRGKAEDKVAHWRLGYFLFLPVGLNLVALTLLLRCPPIIVPFLQIGQDLAIVNIC